MQRYLSTEEIDIVRQAGYHENGLKYTIEELKEVMPDDLSIEELAKYADGITYIKVTKNDVEFFKPQLVPIPPGQTVSVTVTGLGNLSYIALNMPDLETRQKAVLLFQQIVSNYDGKKKDG